MFETVQTYLYDLSQWANALVGDRLAHPSWTSGFVVFGAGLLTSLTPCTLSMLPIVVGYIGGYNRDRPRWQAALQSAWFSLGLASTLAALGAIAALFGRVYGQVGWGLPVAVSLVAIVMGLNLLDLVPLRLPDWGNRVAAADLPDRLPASARSYLTGLTFGLVASPCSTPVLATLLAWVSATQDPLRGSALLLAYAAGTVAPVAIAGTFAAALPNLLALRNRSGWLVPASGALLLGFGTFSLLNALPLGWLSRV